MRDMSRRRWLETVGLGIGAWPLLPVLDAQADTAGAPKRLVYVHQPHVCSTMTLDRSWKPEGSEDSFTLGEILEPLAPYRDQLVVIDGLTPFALEGSSAGHSHVRGTYGFSTGRPAIEGGPKGHPAGPSFDQVIAKRIGDATPYESLQIGVASRSFGVSATGPAEPLTADDDPASVFERLFGSGTSAAMEDPAVARRRAERRSVLDFVRGDLRRVRDRVSAADRGRMESHLDAIRAIERNLDASGAECTDPDAPPASDPGDPDAIPAVTRLQRDLVVAALRCDLTRVVTFQVGTQSGILKAPLEWAGASDTYHHHAHRTGSNSPEASEVYVEVSRWLAGEVAQLIETMASIPEGDGTMLDNTLVFWGTPPGHGAQRMAIVTAGGSGLGVPTGRFLSISDRSSNDLLANVCQRFGLSDVGTFGDPEYADGPLDVL